MALQQGAQGLLSCLPAHSLSLPFGVSVQLVSSSAGAGRGAWSDLGFRATFRLPEGGTARILTDGEAALQFRFWPLWPLG